MQTGQDRPEDAILGMKHIKEQFEDQLKLIKSTGKNTKSVESIEKNIDDYERIGTGEIS